MKAMFIIIGLITAAAGIFGPYGVVVEKDASSGSMAVSPEFKWTQVAPPGSGTHQYEWRPGTYPSAIVPIARLNNDLWMIGQKRAWSSSDGIKWRAFDKLDWGERISMAHVFFKDKFWVSGGMDYATNAFLNEIWSSEDGINWKRAVQHAEWPARKGHAMVEFNKKLWLFGGSVSVNKERVPDQYINDIWSSADGIEWTKEVDEAPWAARDYPRVLVFKNALWLVGGQGHSDIWRSEDGRHWKQVKTESPWKDRFDFGALTYDNLMWVYGGRTDDPRDAYKDVWFSINGSDWQLQTENAPWTPRSGGNSVVFNDKLWLYGGKHTGHKDSFSGDIWTMERGYRRDGEKQ